MPRPVYEVMVGDETFKVSPHGWADREALETLVRELVPDPVARLASDVAGFAPEIGEKLALAHFGRAHREKRDLWPPRFGSPEFLRALLGSAENLGRLLYLALKVHQPEITLARSIELAKSAYGDRERDDQIGEIVVRFLVRDLPDGSTVQEVWRQLSDQDGMRDAVRELVAVLETQALESEANADANPTTATNAA